jgi:hypothetical protein
VAGYTGGSHQQPRLRKDVPVVYLIAVMMARLEGSHRRWE